MFSQMRWLGILVLAVDEMVGDLDYCCRLYDWGFSWLEEY